LTGTVEEAIKVGADAVSYHINVLSEYEGNQIEALAKITKDANEFGMPVLVMCYVRGHEVDTKDPGNVSRAVRLGEELGGDIIKTVYTGDSKSFESVVAATSKPVVIAGGKKGTDKETIEMVKGAMDAGAAGVSMGRCIFQHKDPESISRAVVEIVHNGASVEKAMEKSGLLEK
jgi:fructose-bisphosphate aldolase/2-amino-3,7-dideoxy-D-threo-hept-6-ulosonate synthase